MSGYMFFYSNEGIGAISKIDENGNYQGTLHTLSGFNKNWSQIVSVGQYLFFYSNEGIGAISKIDENGNYQGTLHTLSGFSNNWSQIVSVSPLRVPVFPL